MDEWLDGDYKDQLRQAQLYYIFCFANRYLAILDYITNVADSIAYKDPCGSDDH